MKRKIDQQPILRKICPKPGKNLILFIATLQKTMCSDPANTDFVSYAS